MLVRICVFLCVAIFLANASPVPQDTSVIALSSNSELTESTDSDSKENEPNTEDPINSDDDSTESSSESYIEDSGSDGEIETQDTPVKSEEGDIESGIESDRDDDSEQHSGDSSNDDSEYVEHESTEGYYEPQNEGASDHEHEASNTKDDDSNSDNENKVDGESDEESENDEPTTDSVLDDGETEQNLSVIQVNGILLRVYQIFNREEEITCQEIKRYGNRLEVRCVTTPRSLYHTSGNIVTVYNELLHGDIFICQEIANIFDGRVRVLCASENDYFYHETIISTRSKRLAQPGFGLG